jgi:class 3 adenylate cyclase
LLLLPAIPIDADSEQANALSRRASLCVGLVSLKHEHGVGSFKVRMVTDGTLDPANEPASTAYLSAALAETPQVAALAIIRTDLRQIRVERQGGSVVARSISMRTVPGLHEAFELAKSAGQPVWGELLWSERLNQPLVNIRTPLWREGVFIGILLTAVTVAELSAFVVDPSPTPGTATFILSGRESVLAHAALARAPALFTSDRPLPGITEVGDRILASIWAPPHDTGPAAARGLYEGHAVIVDDVPYVFLSRELTGYSDQPWLIGRYMPLEGITSEVQRLERATWIGVMALLSAVAGAWLLGSAVERTILRLAQGTAAIRNLDLASARPLGRSRLRELDEAIGAYNALVVSLHWFETYVPRNLVRRLMAQGDQGLAPEERRVTVLFTDTAGFTALAERLSAAQTAAFLNEHFRLLATCIEAEEGTIDKFIGDSLMAFWGAPERQPDQAARACRAARTMADAIIADNQHRRQQGLGPVRIRIGIHTGSAIVGNIGSPGRVNYTIVNIAQRIVDVAKEHLAEHDEVVALASDAVLQSADASCVTHSVGCYTLRGRREATHLVRLL